MIAYHYYNYLLMINKFVQLDVNFNNQQKTELDFTSEDLN